MFPESLAQRAEDCKNPHAIVRVLSIILVSDDFQLTDLTSFAIQPQGTAVPAMLGLMEGYRGTRAPLK